MALADDTLRHHHRREIDIHHLHLSAHLTPEVTGTTTVTTTDIPGVDTEAAMTGTIATATAIVSTIASEDPQTGTPTMTDTTTGKSDKFVLNFNFKHHP